MKINTILAPVDFSECSFGVAEQAAGMARLYGARLVFLHVLHAPEGLNLSLRVFPDPEQMGQTLADLMSAEATPLMARYEAIAAAAEVESATKMVGGDVADTILDVARDIEADLIVMGTHGRTGLQRLMLGSQAESVVRRSTAPVLTIRSQHKATCEASSCASCRSGITTTADQAMAELDG